MFKSAHSLKKSYDKSQKESSEKKLQIYADILTQFQKEEDKKQKPQQIYDILSEIIGNIVNILIGEEAAATVNIFE